MTLAFKRLRTNMTANTLGASTHPGSYTRLHNLIRTTASHLLDADQDVHATFSKSCGN